MCLRIVLALRRRYVCCHCGRKGYHNRCLCPQKFTRQETDALLVMEPGQSSSENNTDPTSSTDESMGL